MQMPGAPIMGTRVGKLNKAARDCLVLTKKMLQSYCKAVCGNGGKIKVIDRDHNTLCRKTTGRIADVSVLFRRV